MGELSYRDDVADGVRLAPAWRALFTAWPDRFLLGFDTWTDERGLAMARSSAGPPLVRGAARLDRR